MFNQFKLLLVLITLGILGILFFQNQEPISLKLLCADTASQYCWYQTPTQPLAIWMGLFLIVGVISSLIWQLLQNLGSPRSKENYGDRDESLPRRERNYPKEVSSPSATKTSRTARKPSSYSGNQQSSTSAADWEYSGQGEDWESEGLSSQKVNPTINRDDTVKGSSFEVKQEPQNINQSGSTYSYQFKESQKSGDQAVPSQRQDSVSKSTEDKSTDNKSTEDVYDANYRTINTPRYSDINKKTDTSEDDEDWI